jgi:voltage-gated potassium channel
MLKNQVTTRFTESVIQQDSELVGLTLNEAQIPNRTGLVVVAVRTGEQEFVYNPSGSMTLDVEYALIVIADNEQLQRLHKLTGDSR